MFKQYAGDKSAKSQEVSSLKADSWLITGITHSIDGITATRGHDHAVT